jgi:hypothetical protein
VRLASRNNKVFFSTFFPSRSTWPNEAGPIRQTALKRSSESRSAAVQGLCVVQAVHLIGKMEAALTQSLRFCISARLINVRLPACFSFFPNYKNSPLSRRSQILYSTFTTWRRSLLCLETAVMPLLVCHLQTQTPLRPGAIWGRGLLCAGQPMRTSGFGSHMENGFPVSIWRTPRKPRKFDTVNALNTHPASKNFTPKSFAIIGLHTYVMPIRCDCSHPDTRR